MDDNILKYVFDGVKSRRSQMYAYEKNKSFVLNQSSWKLYEISLREKMKDKFVDVNIRFMPRFTGANILIQDKTDVGNKIRHKLMIYQIRGKRYGIVILRGPPILKEVLQKSFNLIFRSFKPQQFLMRIMKRIADLEKTRRIKVVYNPSKMLSLEIIADLSKELILKFFRSKKSVSQIVDKMCEYLSIPYGIYFERLCWSKIIIDDSSCISVKENRIILKLKDMTILKVAIALAMNE